MQKTSLLILLFIATLPPIPPQSYAQWVQAGKNTGISGSSFSVSGAYILEEADAALMFSTNSGLTWSQVGENIRLPVIKTSNNTGNLVFVGASNSGIVVSTDEGVSWTSPADSGLGNVNLKSLIAVQTNGEDYLLAGTSNGMIFRSADSGNHWTLVFGESTAINPLAISCFTFSSNGQRSTNVFAGTGGIGVLRSIDNGMTWAQVDSGLTYLAVNCLLSEGSNIFAGTYGDGIFLSTNNGDSWKPASTGLSNQIVWGLASNGSYIIAGTYGGGAFLSSDEGTTWNTVNSGLANQYLYSVAASGSNFIAGTDGGGTFLSTDNGVMWSPIRSTSVNSNVRSFVSNDRDIFSGTNNGIFRSTDDGSTWVYLGLAKLTVFSLAFSNDSSYLFAGTDSGIFRSMDRGLNWSRVGFSDTLVLSLTVNGTKLYAGISGPSPLTLTGDGVYVSSDNGVTWSETGSIGGNSVLSIAVRDNYLFAGTETFGVYYSTNYGALWNQVNSEQFDDVYSLAITSEGGNGMNVFAGTDGHVYVSTDSGASWTSVLDIGRLGPPVYAIAVVPTSKPVTDVLVGSGSGIYLSTDAGSTWAQINTGFPGAGSYFGMALSMNSSYLFAGTYGVGVWRRPLSEIITAIKNNQSSFPTRFFLLQNYPNPFNPTTLISYQLPTPNFVSLEIYDVLGRKIKSLIEERQNSGAHSVTFNAEDLPSGVYFYRLESGTHNETKKLLLLR